MVYWGLADDFEVCEDLEEHFAGDDEHKDGEVFL